MADAADLRTDLGATIAYWAAATPEGIAMHDGQHQMSYAEFDQAATRMAKAFVASGLVKGARIAWLGKNAMTYFVMMVAASRAGLVIAPIGWRLAAPEIRYILSDTQAVLLVCEPGFADSVRELETVLPDLQTILVDGSANGITSLADWIVAQADAALPPCQTSDGVLQLYTSGTTGNPKGAVLSNSNLFSMRPGINAANLHWVKMQPDDSLLIIMPVGHIAGSGSGPIAFYNGSCAIICAEFSPDAVLDAVERGMTHMFLVPTALQMVINHPRAASTDFSRVRSVMYGAAPIPLELLRQSMAVMPADYAQQYGMTETTGTICALHPHDHDPAGNARMRGIGVPLPGVEMKIVDAAGAEMPVGEIGEIVTRSGFNMLGYWQNDVKTRETIDAEGWLRTGDAAIMDADGYFYIQDRVKDMIISGGENIYPAEVENAIFGHPDVLEVAVFGVPDGKWGEAVKACVVPQPRHTVDAQSVINWARQRLAGYKVPKSIDVIDVMPRGPSGKILRRALRDPYWEGYDRKVG